MKVVALKDNPELPSKKFALISMISPESRQKHSVHAFKIHDILGTEEEAKMMVPYYQKLDDFVYDIYLTKIGSWLPFVFNPDDVSNQEFANQQLADLVQGHKMTRQVESQEFENRLNKLHEKPTFDKVSRHAESLKQRVSNKEFQKEKAKDESCISMLYRVKQLELVIERYSEELLTLKDVYNEIYTREEKDEADTKNYPIPEPKLFYYHKLQEQEQEDNSSSSSVIEPPIQQGPRKTLEEVRNDILARVAREKSS
jgi:hypothetical protein